MSQIWARLFFRQGKRKPQKSIRTSNLVVEFLELRDCPATLHPDYLLSHGGASQPLVTSGPTGTTPAQIRHAYGFDQISFNGVSADGAGMTIAIVDAYDDPTIANDLHQFDLKFGLPDPSFTKVNQAGGTTMPTADKGWASEIALDVEWAHAIAPRANILLVEASDASDANLFAAVRYAASQPGVVAVSMSFGGGEFSGETTFDSSFRTPTGHGGVTFIASSGDSGAPASYPATSPNILAVGGTTSQLDSSGNILSEAGWSGSGGGISAYESQPSYQKGIVTQSTTKRGNPDVAYDSDPNTGFPVYDSFNNGTAAPWSQFGGTSDAAPQWAALVAIADQGRSLVGLGSLDGATQTLPAIYALPAADFHDIVSGTSSGSPNLSAAAGYDLVTGRGTPIANRVVADLIGQTTTTGAVRLTVSAPSTSVAGVSFTVTVSAVDASGAVVPGYRGTVAFSSSDPLAGLPASYAFTATDAGIHRFTVTLKTAGTESIGVSDGASLTGSASVAVTAAAASKLAFGQQPTSTMVGAVLSPAVTVRALDPFGNLATSDNSDVVTLTLTNNSGGATLGGTVSVIMSGGIATFANLSVSAAATNLVLSAVSGSLTAATSAAFTVSATPPAPSGGIVEDFESSHSWNYTGRTITAVRTTAARHDGTYGLDDKNGNDWIYRSDAAAQVKAGDTISVWLKLDSIADGRAYFGFGASAIGALSLVVAPNSNQLILQNNLGFGYTDLAAVSQSFAANHWYRLEVDWSSTGAIVGKLFDSDGVTLLKSVSAATTAISAGGFGFRATGSDKFWDTVSVTHGVNSFALPGSGSTASGGGWYAAWIAAWNTLWGAAEPSAANVIAESLTPWTIDSTPRLLTIANPGISEFWQSYFLSR